MSFAMTLDAHHLRLADAVRAVGGLVLRGGVPPGSAYHHRRAGEVESGAARFERYEEHGRVVVVERAFTRSSRRFFGVAPVMVK